MIRRILALLLMFAIPWEVHATGYVVQPGDTLSGIAARYGISVTALARSNGIANINLVQAGQSLLIPVASRAFSYRVRWGDTLSGIAGHFGISIATIRSLNPHLGSLLLAGQVLHLCHPCGSGNAYTFTASTAPTGSTVYTVHPGDTLSGIAVRYGVTVASLLAANQLTNPDQIIIGMRLTVPAATYDTTEAQSLIVHYAQVYGIAPSFVLAVAWQESGYNENVVSRTGAVGVMQVEPYTADRIAALWGRPVNLYNLDDNIHAGVFWLRQLLDYYNGNGRLALAAYYEGTRALAAYGMFSDTKQYVNNILALQTRFAG